MLPARSRSNRWAPRYGSHLRPGGALAVAVVLASCVAEDRDLAGPSEPYQPWHPPALITLVSGDGQHALAGEVVSQPLVVRVTDARGQGVPAVPVAWSASVADGLLHYYEGAASLEGGFARAWFEPLVVGTHEVEARVISIEGAFDEAVRFRVQADGIRVELVHGNFGWGNFGFYAPDDSEGNVVVPVGYPVVWVNLDEEPHFLRSTAAPSGGVHFESGWLRPGERFHFVPAVPGIWEYVDEATETVGTLTVEE